MSRVRHKRLRRHLTLATAALGTFTLVFLLVGLSPEQWVDIPQRKAESLQWRVTISLAYTALVFLAAVLATGPLDVLRGRPLAANNMTRRDMGYWAGGLGLVHMLMGVQVHTVDWQLWTLWFHQLPGPGDWLPLHKTTFGLANYAGLAQAGLLAVLLIISNNKAMRTMGVRRWKTMQRLSYVVIGLVTVHGLAYQSVERRDAVIRLAFMVVIAAVVGLQLTGFMLRKRRERQRDGERAARAAEESAGVGRIEVAVTAPGVRRADGAGGEK